MNREQFMTCTRAYFPDAPFYSLTNSDGMALQVTFRHNTIIPFCIKVYYYLHNEVVDVYAGGYKFADLSEEKLLMLLKRLNTNIWRVV
jgi:hypothetical protein